MRWLCALLLPFALITGLGVPRATAAPSAPSYLVLIVLDGARPDYFNVPKIPHIEHLIKHGAVYTNAFAGILESETPSGHAAIASGSEPRQDGILSFSWANSDNIPVDLFNPAKIRAGAMEQIIEGSHTPTLAQDIHARHHQVQVVALSGSKYYAADALGGPSANIIMYFRGTADGQFAPTFIPGHAPPPSVLNDPHLVAPNFHRLPLGLEDHLAMTLAIDTFKTVHQRVTLINLPEFDWPLGHVDGSIRDPSAVRYLMQYFDYDLGLLMRAYRQAGILAHTLFVLTADHGFAPLSHHVANTDLQQAVSRAGTSLVWQGYNTASYLWLRDKSKVWQAGQNIAALKDPYIQSVYAKVHAGNSFHYQRISRASLLHTPAVEGANRYLLHTFDGPNGPDLVVLFTEQVGSEPGGQASWKGDHGGASWEAQHIPLILSGPGVKRGFTSSYPARLIDIAPTALQLMHISHAHMQGIPLADAMVSPPARAAARQKRLTQPLMTVVTALQTESRLELAAHQ